MTSSAPGLKRKTKPFASSLAKRVKIKHVLTDDLAWKKVKQPREADLGTGLDGFLELEEIEDVDVVYEETEGGKVALLKVRPPSYAQERMYTYRVHVACKRDQRRARCERWSGRVVESDFEGC